LTTLHQSSSPPSRLTTLSLVPSSSSTPPLLIASGTDTRVACFERDPTGRWILKKVHRPHTHPVTSTAIIPIDTSKQKSKHHQKEDQEEETPQEEYLLLTGSIDTKICSVICSRISSTRPRKIFTLPRGCSGGSIVGGGSGVVDSWKGGVITREEGGRITIRKLKDGRNKVPNRGIPNGGNSNGANGGNKANGGVSNGELSNGDHGGKLPPVVGEIVLKEGGGWKVTSSDVEKLGRFYAIGGGGGVGLYRISAGTSTGAEDEERERAGEERAGEIIERIEIGDGEGGGVSAVKFGEAIGSVPAEGEETEAAASAKPKQKKKSGRKSKASSTESSTEPVSTTGTSINNTSILLAVSRNTGIIEVHNLCPLTFKITHTKEVRHNSTSPATVLEFSPCGTYLAAMSSSAGSGIIVYTVGKGGDVTDEWREWWRIGEVQEEVCCFSFHRGEFS